MDNKRTSMADAILTQSGTLKDYKNAESLYKRMRKEKARMENPKKSLFGSPKPNPARDQKNRERLASLLNDAQETLERLVRTYQAQMDAMAKDKPEIEVEIDGKTYVDKLNEHLTKIKIMREEFPLNSNAESKAAILNGEQK